MTNNTYQKKSKNNTKIRQLCVGKISQGGRERERESGAHEQIKLLIIVIKVNKDVFLKNSISNLPEKERWKQLQEKFTLQVVCTK